MIGNQVFVSALAAIPLFVFDPLLDALQRWADDDLRSLNAQIEFLLRRVVREAGRLKDPAEQPPETGN